MNDDDFSSVRLREGLQGKQGGGKLKDGEKRKREDTPGDDEEETVDTPAKKTKVLEGGGEKDRKRGVIQLQLTQMMDNEGGSRSVRKREGVMVPGRRRGSSVKKRQRIKE